MTQSVWGPEERAACGAAASLTGLLWLRGIVARMPHCDMRTVGVGDGGEEAARNAMDAYHRRVMRRIWAGSK